MTCRAFHYTTAEHQTIWSKKYIAILVFVIVSTVVLFAMRSNHWKEYRSLQEARDSLSPLASDRVHTAERVGRSDYGNLAAESMLRDIWWARQSTSDAAEYRESVEPFEVAILVKIIEAIPRTNEMELLRQLVQAISDERVGKYATKRNYLIYIVRGNASTQSIGDAAHALLIRSLGQDFGADTDAWSREIDRRSGKSKGK